MQRNKYSQRNYIKNAWHSGSVIAQLFVLNPFFSFPGSMSENERSPQKNFLLLHFSRGEKKEREAFYLTKVFSYTIFRERKEEITCDDKLGPGPLSTVKSYEGPFAKKISVLMYGRFYGEISFNFQP